MPVPNMSRFRKQKHLRKVYFISKAFYQYFIVKNNSFIFLEKSACLNSKNCE